MVVALRSSFARRFGENKRVIFAWFYARSRAMTTAPARTKPTASSGTIDKVIVVNRRATFDYHIEEKFEGGLVLVGSEVKAMRDQKVEVVDAFAAVANGELWLKQLYIAPFTMAKSFPHEPRRARKVLMRSSEIARIDRAVSREGMTLIPLRLYFKRGRVKVELGLAKGKKTHDKRADIKRKDADREARAVMGRARKERG
jgi:SsrA-binding protein